MHVLLVHPYFLPPGAAGSVRWNEMTRHWVVSGHRVTVLAGSVDYLSGKIHQATDNQSENKQVASGIRVIRVSMSRFYNRGRWGRLWAYWTFFWNSLGAGLFWVNGPVDVMLATSPPLTAGLTGYLLARLRGKPFVLEIRDLWPDAPVELGYLTNPFLIRIAHWLERFLYRKAAHIITLTPAFRHVLVTQKGVLPSRCTTISNGADFDLTHSLSEAVDRDKFREQHDLAGRFWVVYTGAHRFANGLPAMIEAAETMKDKPIGFLMIGDGPEKAKLQAETIRRGLINIRFLPAVPKPDVLRWIAAADAGLVIMQPMPIFKTMLSAKLFDYLACGKPVLTAIDGLTRQLAEHHEFGVFVDPENPASWHKQICSYIAQPILGKKHGDNGFRYAQQNANRTTLAHHYLTILNCVCFPDKTTP